MRDHVCVRKHWNLNFNESSVIIYYWNFNALKFRKDTVHVQMQCYLHMAQEPFVFFFFSSKQTFGMHLFINLQYFPWTSCRWLHSIAFPWRGTAWCGPISESPSDPQTPWPSRLLSASPSLRLVRALWVAVSICCDPCGRTEQWTKTV